MKHVLLFLAIILASAFVYAKGVDSNFSVNATTYSDGILLEGNSQDIGLQLTIVGPDNSRYTQRYSSADAVFLDINSANGQPLVDGFYKYEARPIAAVINIREESAKMPDRNSLMDITAPKVSAVSGSFRIVNGIIVDPELIEYDSSLTQENAK